MNKVRDAIDERLYCNGPPESTATPPKDVPMVKPALHVEIIKGFHPINKYQLQWIPHEDGGRGMYWDIRGEPFASVERYAGRW